MKRIWKYLFGLIEPTEHGCYQPNKDDTKYPPPMSEEYLKGAKSESQYPPILWTCNEKLHNPEPIEPFETIKILNELAFRFHAKDEYVEAGKMLLIIKRKIAQYEENEMYKS